MVVSKLSDMETRHDVQGFSEQIQQVRKSIKTYMEHSVAQSVSMLRWSLTQWFLTDVSALSSRPA